ncbi:RDD family protein [Streptomyces gobiensis]|uniref:RDD family protein n=1 Tax=Streptomyces gobiensis TaxID=2875706 RepID=UPI001E5D0483|nr:RDD family protein [Streptomyces gobiensis]UGY91663.1 RDD family protein [Streptomyces gobiensis]
MSTDQPQPGSGDEPPEQDPFRKSPEEPPPGGGGGPPHDAAPPPPPPPPGGGGPYGESPYGGGYGAPDPLAGMPPLASRGRRLLARIVDALIIGIPVSLVLALLLGPEDFAADGGAGGNFGGGFARGLVYSLVYFVYEGLMLTARGQTLGKMLLRIRVGMLENGSIPAGNPGWYRAGVYTLPPIVPCLGTLFWLVNVLFCVWDKPYRQCVHDKAAKTVVVAA